MSQGEDLFGIRCNKGEVIFCQGDQGDTMYIIQSGDIEKTTVMVSKSSLYRFLKAMVF